MIENVFTKPKMQKLWKKSKYNLFYSLSKLTHKSTNASYNDHSIIKHICSNQLVCLLVFHFISPIVGLGGTEVMLLHGCRRWSFREKSRKSQVSINVETNMLHHMKDNDEYYMLWGVQTVVFHNDVIIAKSISIF